MQKARAVTSQFKVKGAVAELLWQWQTQARIESTNGFLPCPGRALLHSGRNRGPCCQVTAFSSVRLSKDFRSSTIASLVALLGKIRTDVTSDRNTPKQMPEILVSVKASAPANACLTWDVLETFC